MTTVRVFPGGLEAIARSVDTAGGLREIANEVSTRVDAPSHLNVRVKAGIARSGRRQAFSQVIMEGPGALTEEFGNRSRAPKAPLRRALRGGR